MHFCRRSCLVGFILVFSWTSLQSQTCSQFNASWSQPISGTDWTQHGTGNHSLSGSLTGSCNYVGPAGSSCSVTCQANYSATTSESGLLTNPFKDHAPAYGGASGTATSNGGAATCASQVAVGVRSCLRSFGTDETISK